MEFQRDGSENTALNRGKTIAALRLSNLALGNELRDPAPLEIRRDDFGVSGNWSDDYLAR